MTRRTQNPAATLERHIRTRIRELRQHLTQHPEDWVAHAELASLIAQLDEVS